MTYHEKQEEEQELRRVDFIRRVFLLFLLFVYALLGYQAVLARSCEYAPLQPERGHHGHPAR